MSMMYVPLATPCSSGDGGGGVVLWWREEDAPPEKKRAFGGREEEEEEVISCTCRAPLQAITVFHAIAMADRTGLAALEVLIQF
ncbi:hypothetical protein GUJ93_ZPchr0458g22726 [Zizania palustris]|uniref:Uncharacterized protein n=1 Tax=Zizania palustris TaxID=103762 RepID=A0A8J5RDP6_ZIZPA|nr:hypothetical protein GUJ93_ZPchr0458g22726 [Zizania palustris]